MIWLVWTLGTLVPIAAGLWLLRRYFVDAGPNYLIRYTFGDRPDPAPVGFESSIRHVIELDWLVIFGYVLLLGICAGIFAALAFSKQGQKLSVAIGVALLATAGADLAENGLVLWSLHPPTWGLLAKLPDSFWKYAPEALATAKWCAALIAVLAIPAALFSVVRLLISYWRRWRYRCRHSGEWWKTALGDIAATPELTEGDPEGGWRRAYFVPSSTPQDAPGSSDAKKDTPKIALCLSGGGIRSACVAMGAMQTLARPADDTKDRWNKAPFLDTFDYVISVSGGGYSAGARLMGVQSSDGKNGNPFGPIYPLSDRFPAGSVEFDFLRRRSSYIADSPAALIRALAEVMKNLLASLFMVFSIAAVAGWLLGWFLAKIPLTAFVPSTEFNRVTGPHVQSLDGHAIAAAAAIAIPLAVAVIFTGCALFCEWKSTSERFTALQGRFSALARAGWLLAVVVLVITVALPGLMRIGSYLVPVGNRGGHAVGTASGLAGVVLLHYVATLGAMVWRQKDTISGGESWLKKVLPPGVMRIGLVLVTLAILFAAWLVIMGIVAAQIFTRADRNITQVTHIPFWGWILGGLALFIVMLSSVDVTSLSLHPFYRQRLARTFAVRREGGKAVGYDAKEPTWLDKYGMAQQGKPEFVFACAAAISDDDVRPAPGLNAVSFVMGANHIGGPALGWLSTAGLREAAAARIERDLTVQAAVAVSGAAFASAMGRQSKGFQTILALSGARLGTWLPNPAFVRNAQSKVNDASFPKALPSVRGAGYFYRELFGINKPDARLVQVTDGGHYENLGLVEALRRKCRLIYCIDAGGDTPPLLSGLDDAIRLAKFELGVEITLDHGGDYGVESLAPGSGRPFGKGHAFHILNDRLTKDAVVRAEIQYPEAAGLGDADASRGWLVVAKAALWRDLPDWVLTYGAEKDGQDFPHDKTSDQWFNEAQFAAYTEVGRRIAERALQVRADAAVRRPHTAMPTRGGRALTNGPLHPSS
jgi:hypothetical protein